MGWETTAKLSPATWILHHLEPPEIRLHRNTARQNGSRCHVPFRLPVLKIKGDGFRGWKFLASYVSEVWIISHEIRIPFLKQPVLIFRGELLVFRGVLGRLLFSCGVVGETCLFVPLSNHYILPSKMFTFSITNDLDFAQPQEMRVYRS